MQNECSFHLDVIPQKSLNAWQSKKRRDFWPKEVTYFSFYTRWGIQLTEEFPIHLIKCSCRLVWFAKNVRLGPAWNRIDGSITGNGTLLSPGKLQTDRPVPRRIFTCIQASRMSRKTVKRAIGLAMFETGEASCSNVFSWSVLEEVIVLTVRVSVGIRECSRIYRIAASLVAWTLNNVCVM